MHVSVHCMTMRMKSYSANVAWEKGMHVDFLMQIVLEEGLWIASRHMDSSLAHDSWTCCRCFDDAQVQIDFILADKKYQFGKAWCDFAVGLGLDHRCVHCILRLPFSKPSHHKKMQSLKGWKPFVGDPMEPLQFHDWIRCRFRAGPVTSFRQLERIL